MTTETALLTADDLLRLHSQGVRGELVRGVLCETMATGREHGEVAANMSFELLSYIKPRKLGIVTTSDSGVRVERNPDTVREPDVAYFSTERIVGGRVTGYSDVAPNLVIEIVSPHDDLDQVQAKAEMWLSVGVELVWVIHPETRSVEVHQSDQPVEQIDEADELDGLHVLPGFTCPVTAAFGE